MGGHESKGQVISDKPPPAQANLPPEPPYPGPCAQYHFINTEVVMGTQWGGFTSSPMVTSNIDQYYPMLAAQYNEGFRLLSFYRIPGQVRQAGFTSVASGFQGIFCRYPTVPRREMWQLRVEKSTIQLHQVFTGLIRLNQNTVVSNTTQVLDCIARNTQGGGRLVCVELTGEQQAASMGMAMQGISPLMGVDLFFEVPPTPGPQYVYNCVSVPITVTIKMGFNPVPEVHCDWIGNLAHNLNQGWRLVEIFIDKTEHTRARGFTGMNNMNSMWFFEKPASCMQDPRPRYEGTVIDHPIKIKQSFGGTSASANWENVIQDMGNRGWELACILETPEIQRTGLTTIYMTVKMFFQRPILSGFYGPPGSGATSLPADLPPPYDLVVAGGGGGAQGSGAPPAPPPAYPSASYPPADGDGGAVGGGGGGVDGSGSAAPPPIGFETGGPPPPPPEKMGY